MRVSFFLPAFALLSTGFAGSVLAQHEHSSDSEGLHSHLSRIFSSNGADTAEAPEACCTADSTSEATPVAARAQDGERGFIGIQMNVTDGAMVVAGVIDGSPAAQAGLEAGDRILRIGSHEVAGQEALTGFLAGIRPGQTEKIVVERNGWTKKVELTFAPRPDFDQDAPEVVELREQFGSGHQDLDGDAKKELKRKIHAKLDKGDAGGQRGFVFKHAQEGDAEDHHDADHD
ncbi:MAG: membrane-associated protease RseP (regulator of RpoE activity), partial [Gammaproteobacteria bacterium]